jgi:SAM-dependent methyltransferase
MGALSRRKSLLALAGLGLAACDRTVADGLKPLERELDVPYVPTPLEVIEQMLSLAQPQDGELLIDLGCGDGRIVNTAASRVKGLKGLGVDIDPDRIREARAGADKAGVSDRVEFRQQDLFETDISAANVLTMYLLPEINVRLRNTSFATLKPGTRVVSHDFDMGEWTPDRVVETPGEGSRVHFWIIPAQVSGSWRFYRADGPGPRPDGTFEIVQAFQNFAGTGEAKGQFTIADGTMAGAQARFAIVRPDGFREAVSATFANGQLSGTMGAGKFFAERTLAPSAPLFAEAPRPTLP